MHGQRSNESCQQRKRHKSSWLARVCACVCVCSCVFVFVCLCVLEHTKANYPRRKFSERLQTWILVVVSSFPSSKSYHSRSHVCVQASEGFFHPPNSGTDTAPTGLIFSTRRVCLGCIVWQLLLRLGKGARAMTTSHKTTA